MLDNMRLIHQHSTMKDEIRQLKDDMKKDIEKGNKETNMHEDTKILQFFHLLIFPSHFSHFNEHKILIFFNLNL